MNATNYFENQILNLLRGISITAPKAVYLGLFLSNPTDTGDAGEEIAYSTYQRQPVTFAVPAEGLNGVYIANSREVEFPECNTDSGTVNYVGVFDAMTGGNMLLYAQLTNPMLIQAGIAPMFDVSALRWDWDGNITAAMKTAIFNTLRGTDLAGITIPYVALCNGDPTDGGTEFSGGNYNRIPVAFSAPEQQESGVAITVNTAIAKSTTATDPWGRLTHIAIYDAATGGKAYAVMEVPTAFSVVANMTVALRAGALVLTVN